MKQVYKYGVTCNDLFLGVMFTELPPLYKEVLIYL